MSARMTLFATAVWLAVLVALGVAALPTRVQAKGERFQVVATQNLNLKGTIVARGLHVLKDSSGGKCWLVSEGAGDDRGGYGVAFGPEVPCE